MTPPGRQRAQLAIRFGALLFVLAWLLSRALQAAIPFWLPFAILGAAELEFLVQGVREARAPATGAGQPMLERRLPGRDDADLGWVETLDEDGLPILAPAPPAGRRRSRLPLAAVVALAAALFVLALRVDARESWSSLGAAARRGAENRFTAEAARIAGRPVTVRCDEQYAFAGVGSDAAGVAFIGSRIAYLDPAVCHALRQLIESGAAPRREAAAFAVTVLAHEAIHLRGVRDESVTECYALQEGVGLGARLGLPTPLARELMLSQQARDLSARGVQRLDYRLPAGCRNGGALDLRPADSSFP